MQSGRISGVPDILFLLQQTSLHDEVIQCLALEVLAARIFSIQLLGERVHRIHRPVRNLNLVSPGRIQDRRRSKRSSHPEVVPIAVPGVASVHKPNSGRSVLGRIEAELCK